MRKDAALFSLVIFALAAGVIGSELLAHCRHDGACRAEFGLPGASADPAQDMASLKTR